jgi:uncharacterized repeat protein (TIGR01451 family)
MPTSGTTSMRRRWLAALSTLAIVLSLFPGSLLAAGPIGSGTYAVPAGDPEVNPFRFPGREPLEGQEEDEDEFLLKQDDATITRRTAGDHRLSIDQAALHRSEAATAAHALKATKPAISPLTYVGPWTEISPNPIVQVNRGSSTFYAVSGRVSALAIRPSNGLKILGGAQGGIWTYDEETGTWIPRTDDQKTLSIGAIAIAPSDDSIVYAGTGEGNLSGDSYFGHGFLKSTDGGIRWAPIGGDTFVGVSISKVVVDPTDPNHVYASVIRGRAGSRRQTPPFAGKYGIWESTNGGAKWKNIKKAKDEVHGATDLAMDPLQPNILYASFWGEAIYRSTNGGQTWAPFMAGIPAAATFGTGGGTRFALGISHPAGHAAVLYAGFEWTVGGVDQPSRIWKSIDGGPWQLLPTGSGVDNIEDYCGGQCFYDNVIGVDPTNSDNVYALGLFNYGTGSGGVFRSTDGGQTWKDLGWDLHPDYHAIAIDPTNTSHVLIGSDGGVWYSETGGGRQGAADPLSANDWADLNGTVDPNTAGVTHRTGLRITQFTSIANVPTVPNRVFGGTQDNGTLRKSTASASWFDVESGDGGQVLVDPTDANFVYGNYFGISPYRNTDGALPFFSNAFITSGINLADRSEFYVPETMNQGAPNQLFLGTYRLYRTDNAKTPTPSNVQWHLISPDLTSGCTGGAPNGARGCLLSAIGLSSGGSAVYTGSLEGWVYTSPDAVTNLSPTWTRVGQSVFPNRPVSEFAVDRSNDRIAYVAFNGFNAATPSRPGHVWKTTNGGQTWTNISSNIPDAPVNSLVLDASYPNTLYAGTDVGPFVTYNGGQSWQPLGSGFPTVEIWQLNLDPSNGNLAAGTHGRGAWRLHNDAAAPALVVSKTDAGVPVGAGSTVEYTITLKNIGNAPATGVTISDPIPANTTFAAAGDGGTFAAGTVTWTGLTVAAGTSTDVHFSVTISPSLSPSVSSIVNDGITVTSAEGVGATGSAHATPIAPPYDVSVTPASQTDGGNPGDTVSYHLHVSNLGANADTYALASGGTFTSTVLDGACAAPITSIAVASGATGDICVQVQVPGGATNGTTDTTTLTATSTGDPTVSDSATVKTIAVTVATLLVDNDGNGPDVQAIYAAALTAAGVTFDVWDLATDPVLPRGYMEAHANIVWFTGNSYPAPLGPYEANLTAFLDGGGNLFMSGQDILDQGAGTTPFVHDYLHIDWDGTETQNDKGTANVTSVAGNPVTNGIGTVPLDHSVLGAEFEDQITPIAPAISAFNDDGDPTAVPPVAPEPDALTFSGTYKVVFLAFPFEAYGSAAQKSDLVTRVMTFFGPEPGRSPT